MAGIAYFLVLLYQATGDASWADAARAGAATLLQEAHKDRGGLNWLPLVGATTDLDLAWQEVRVGPSFTRCQWCNGAPGIGLFFVRGYETLGDRVYLTTAEAAGEATYAYGDGRGNPTYCHGLAGNTELLVELHRITGTQRWRDRALDFGQRMLAYKRVVGPGPRQRRVAVAVEVGALYRITIGHGCVSLRCPGLDNRNPAGRLYGGVERGQAKSTQSGLARAGHSRDHEACRFSSSPFDA